MAKGANYLWAGDSFDVYLRHSENVHKSYSWLWVLFIRMRISSYSQGLYVRLFESECSSISRLKLFFSFRFRILPKAPGCSNYERVVDWAHEVRVQGWHYIRSLRNRRVSPSVFEMFPIWECAGKRSCSWNEFIEFFFVMWEHLVASALLFLFFEFLTIF